MNRIYGIYDRKAETIIGGLILQRHPAAAVRYFTDGLTAEGSILKAHPGDFELYELGYLDDESFVIVSQDKQLILSGQAWLDLQEEDSE